MNVAGDIPFEAAGRRRRLKLTINAICALEGHLDRSMSMIAVEMDTDPRFGTIRALFWAAMGEPDLTVAQAGDVIGEIGIVEASAIARRAITAAFPPAGKEPAADGDARPPAAAAG